MVEWCLVGKNWSTRSEDRNKWRRFSIQCYPISETALPFFFKVHKSSPACTSGTSSMLMMMSMQHWWKPNDREKQKYWKKNPSQCYFCTTHLWTELGSNPSVQGESRPKLHYAYTGCPGGNVPDFGRMFLTLKYTDLTQNTYIRSWTVTEIIAREVWKYDSCYTLID